MPINSEDFIQRAIESGKTREQAVQFLQNKGISVEADIPPEALQGEVLEVPIPPSVVDTNRSEVLGPVVTPQRPPVLPPRLSDIDNTPFDAEAFRTEAIQRGQSPETVDEFLQGQGVKAPPEQRSLATTVGRAAINLPGSVFEVGKETVLGFASLTKPESRKALFDVARDAAALVGPLGLGVFGGVSAQVTAAVGLRTAFSRPNLAKTAAKTVGTGIANNLGVIFENGNPRFDADVLRTNIEQRPAEVLADILTIATPLMGVTGGLAGTTKGGRFLQKTAKILDFADPSVLPVKAVGAGTRQIGKLAAPFKDFVDPRVTAIAEKLGLKDLPASARSTNPAVALAEARALKRGETEILRRVEQSAQDLNKAADDVVNRIGGDPTPLGAGRKVVEGLENFDRQADKAIREAFSAIGDTSQIPADFKQTLVKLNEIEARTIASKITDPNVANLRAILEDVLSEDAGTITLQMVDQTRTVFRQIKNRGRKQFLKGGTVQPDLPVDAAYAGEIYDAMTDDLFNAAEAAADPSLANNLRNAKTIYAQAKERINSDIAKKIVSLRDEPDKIVDALINPRMSELTPAKVFELIGEAATKDVQSSFVSRLFDKAKNIDGAWKPLGLKTQLNNFTDPKLRGVLPPDVVESLNEIADVSASFQRLKKVTENSPTGFFIEQMARESEIADAIATVGGFLGGNFDVRGILLTLTQIVGRRGVARFIASNAGQRFLTEGTIGGKAIIGLGEAISRTAPITGRAARQVQRSGISNPRTSNEQFNRLNRFQQ